MDEPVDLFAFVCMVKRPFLERSNSSGADNNILSHSGSSKNISQPKQQQPFWDREENVVSILVDAAWTPCGACVAGAACKEVQRIACWIQKISGSSPTQAESIALLLASKLALRHKWSKLYLFFDAQQVVLSTKEKAEPTLGYCQYAAGFR